MTTKMNYRALSLRLDSAGIPLSLDKKTRSVECTMATESPVPMFDYTRYEVIPEILLMSGCQLPDSRQVPLLDTHSRYSTSSVIGSTREIRVEGDQLVGRDHFSSSPEAEPAWVKTAEGHLTDRSIGYSYSSENAVYVDDGETAIIEGRTFTGPVKVVKTWAVKENSICPIGADSDAKARSDQNHTEELPMSATEKERIQTEAARAERDRCSEIRAMSATFDQEDLGRKLIDNGATIEQARKAVMDAHVEAKSQEETVGYRGPYDHDIMVGKTAKEKRMNAVIDGLSLRAGIHLDKPAPGADEYRQTSLVDLARECLASAGERVKGVGASSIVKRAISHGTSDFSSLLANTANKILRKSYEQAPSSFEQWCRLSDAVDFKEMSRTAISEAPDLTAVGELAEYQYGTFGESKEVFQVAKYGKIFSVSREAIVNDDLSAFTSIPRAFAMAGKRLVNSLAYGVLTTNAAMADGVALFHADHSNYVAEGDGDAPGISTLSAARTAMRLQTGLQGTVLNVAPKFLIVPATLETTADEVLNTMTGLDGTTEKLNPFYKKLELIVEPVLDATSTKGWYLVAHPGQIDTVEVAFLEGRREPYLETRQGWNVDGLEYKVRHEFGVKAIDHRGFYFNYGE